MAKIKNGEKYIKKGRMYHAYNGLDTCIQKEILLEFDSLLSQSKHLNPDINQTILPCIVIYKALLNHNYTKKQAYNIVRKSAMDSYIGVAGFAQTIAKLPFFFSLFRVICRLSMKEGENEKGWTFKWKKNDKYAMEWDCHSCIYVDTFVKNGVRELAPIFCECEDSIYGKLKYTKWGRTKTIGRGADLCNFSFYNTRKEG